MKTNQSNRSATSKFNVRPPTSDVPRSAICHLPSLAAPNRSGGGFILSFLLSAFYFLLCLTPTSAATRYAWQGSPSPAPPYTTWATAATVIQDAVDAAGPGDTVLVTNGTYSAGGRSYSRVSVDKPLVVRSVNGPGVTQIIGYGDFSPGSDDLRCVYLTNGASLSGFTLTNGVGLIGGGVFCQSSAVVVSNCWLVGNTAGSSGGGASGGALWDCILSGNSATFGGGAYCCTLNNCTLRGNSARTDGGGAERAALDNCSLIGNSAGRLGGGALSSTLNNSTVVGNLAGSGIGGADGPLSNCIAYFNTAPVDPNYASSKPLNYCCTSPLPTNGVGNIDLDPLFVDTNGWSNLHLQSNSPCINAGNNAYVSSPTDLDGNPRIVSGTVDMGAYEFVPPPPPTPAELVEHLISLVNESNLRHKRPLLATLNAALASIQRDNCHSAVGQLRAFQNKVGAQVTHPVLTAELISAAGEVVIALNCDGSPRVAPKIRSLRRHANGRLQLQIEGVVDQACNVEASANLVDWETIGTTTLQANGSFEFEDSEAATCPCRFYRLVTSE